MYRKTDTLITALFEFKEGKSAPFCQEVIKIGDNILLIQKKNSSKTMSVPLFMHSFKFITPKKVSEAQKFMLMFPSPDKIVTVADKLRYYRYKNGLYQIDVADYLGIERSTYIEYEKSDRDYYPAGIMDKIAELFDVDVYDLLDDYNKFLYDGQGEYIKKLRSKLGIKQSDLAKMMSVNVCKVKKWEQGKVRMFKYTWEKLNSIV